MQADSGRGGEGLHAVLMGSGLSLSDEQINALLAGETVELEPNNMQSRGRVELGCYKQGELICCAYIETGWPPKVVHECHEAKERSEKEPAPWWKWRSTQTGKTVCVQTSPGEGWEQVDGPFTDSHCTLR